ncbi:hypothetical protein B0J12DRAFT_732507 [Macrophomina phaseolina]|uniref:Carrier domain-containing protein n=1 Tax=Macrophomina phaseolina TaxID=35725 RepID=A0ABQ8FYG2_9PEZI|nr:hypothetical protein B0J12DRAFT_732507 [Macrophomina phaseolina]
MQDTISTADEEQIWQWNADLPVAPEKCIHDIFSEQLQSSLDSPAVDSWDGELTYRKLDELSTNLALHLCSRGAESGSVVPICFDKSLWVVICMLAVIKSGAAFATLDPAMPTERLAATIRAVKPRLMLVGSNQKERFSDLGLELISEVPELCDARPAADIALPQVSPDDLAYVLFTSGSTGIPKVVLHIHKAAALSMRHGTGYGPGARVLQFASQAFGASIWEIFKTLGNGGCLVIPPTRDRLGGIANFITKKQITRTFLTPSLLNLLKPEEVSCLKILTVGGEPVTEQLIKTWAPHVRLMEAFGMTEGVGIETKIDQEGKKTRKNQTLVGTAWIVDAEDPDKLAPIGTAGELVIESPTLCKGYLNNPEANAAAFLAQPLWAKRRGSDRATRLFRTGDLARYIEDGVVQIVGRKDTRVKLYGQRFELGEVEQEMVKSLPAGVSVAAELITPSGGSPMLVAFIHGTTEDFPSVIRDLREKMAVALPDYMVPRGFVELEDRPMNASGKLDRKRLREMASKLSTAELVAHGSDAVKAPPATDMEKKMQALWAETLNLPTSLIGLDDDFFFHGGSSLHCIKLISAARREGISLEIEDIFRGRTLRAMSASARVARETASNDLSIAASRVKISDITDAISESDAWSVYTGLLKTRGWHDYMVFKFTGALEIQRLENACRQLITTYSILRAVFLVHERKTYQVILTDKAYGFPFSVHNVPSGASVPQTRQALIDADIKRETQLGDRLVSFMLVQDNGASPSHELIMRISHAQYDADSVSQIWGALEAAYWGEPAPSAPQFSHYLDNAAAASPAAQSESFWKSHLAAAPAPYILPCPRPQYHNAVDTAAAATAPVPDLRPQGLTTATAVLACWTLVLSQLTQQPSSDVVFGTVVSGRHLSALRGAERTVGPCMNVVPFRGAVDRDATFLALLESVQAAHLRSLPAAHLGTRRIIEECAPRDSWSRWSRFASIVNHVSLGEEAGSQSKAPPFFADARAEGAGVCGAGLEIFEPQHDKAELWLHSMTASGGERVAFELRYSSTVFPRAWVESVLQCFVSMFEQLPALLGEKVGEKGLLWKGLPPGEVALERAAAVGARRSGLVQKEGVDGEAADEVVKGAWVKVFGADYGKSVEGFDSDTPFYEVWGDLIGAAALARAFGEKGYKVSVEDVLDCASISEQVALIGSL